MTRCLFMLCFLLAGSSLFAQNPLQRVYEYDAAGNRTCRRVVQLPEEGGGGGKSLTADNATTGAEADSYYTDEIGDISVQVYPNPVSEKLLIRITNYEDFRSGELSLYSPEGKFLRKIIVHAPDLEINFSAYPTGTYLLKLQFNDFRQEWKIIRQ